MVQTALYSYNLGIYWENKPWDLMIMTLQTNVMLFAPIDVKLCLIYIIKIIEFL